MSHNALHSNPANANGRKHFILLRYIGKFCQDIKREVVQFWVALFWITELEQQIKDVGFFWKLNNYITFCLSEFRVPGSHGDLHVYLVQFKDDTIDGLDSDIRIIEID